MRTLVHFFSTSNENDTLYVRIKYNNLNEDFEVISSGSEDVSVKIHIENDMDDVSIIYELNELRGKKLSEIIEKYIDDCYC